MSTDTVKIYAPVRLPGYRPASAQNIAVEKFKGIVIVRSDFEFCNVSNYFVSKIQHFLQQLFTASIVERLDELGPKTRHFVSPMLSGDSYNRNETETNHFLEA